MSSPRDNAIAVLTRLRERGHTAYLAGGCVRDELLGIAPKDYDVATDATPDQVAGAFNHTSQIGAAFGVVLVRHRPGQATEVATFRTDGDYGDNRRPDSVQFADPEADAQRRDFTINALFLDPLAESDDADPTAGRVIDYVNGRRDLEAKVLRAVGDPDQRLKEDHLRALRAVRFSCRLDFELDQATAEAIRRHTRDLAGVSRERIGGELRAMLTHPARARAARRLTELGLDEPVLSEPTLSVRADESTAVLSDSEGVTMGAALAAWAVSRARAGGPEPRSVVQPWRKAMCLSNDERNELAAILAARDAMLTDWPQLGIAARKRLLASDGAGGAMQVLVREGNTSSVRAAEIEAARPELAAVGGGLWPRSLISGDDLIAEGLSPGPAFSKRLNLTFDAQLEGRVRTFEEAIEFAHRVLDGSVGD